MDKKQFLNFDTNLYGGFTSSFMKFVIIIIAAYLFVLVINFFRDKYIDNEPVSRRSDVSDLLMILSKLFFLSGFGFIIGNITEALLSMNYGRDFIYTLMKLRGEWDYLTFGILIIFIGLGLKAGNKIIKKDKEH